MLYVLNRPKLLIRDIEKFSKDETNVIKQNKKLASLKKISKFVFFGIPQVFIKILLLNLHLWLAIKKINGKFRNDYKEFLITDYRSKEDILIKWEQLSRTLHAHATNELEKASFISKGITDKSFRIIENVNSFIAQLKSALYPSVKKQRSRAEQEKHSAKFLHLPQDVLEDLATD